MTDKVIDKTKEGEKIDEETAAFNAATEALVPEPKHDPLNLKGEEEGKDKDEGKAKDEEKDKDEEKTAEELDKEAEDIAAAAKHFLGDMTQDQVLEKIQSIDGMEAALFEKISQKVFGKFGEIGQSLKALQEREFSFDPEKLVELTKLDEGIAKALAEDLKNAFSGHSFDSEAVIKNLHKEVLADLNPYVEQRLLTALVPDVDKITKTDEFSAWFFKEATAEVRETFQNWDDRNQMDGVKMADAFKQYDAFVEGQKSEKDTKADALKKSVESKKGDTKSHRQRQHMTEDEAFDARTKESRA